MTEAKPKHNRFRFSSNAAASDHGLRADSGWGGDTSAGVQGGSARAGVKAGEV